MILPATFYNRPTIKVAQDLLGCFLVRELPIKSPLLKKERVRVRLKIVETESYDGPRDLASHASRGRTERNSVMFGPPGRLYVYFTYGMHHMLNVVTREINYPAAVLIRAVEPIKTASNIQFSIFNFQTNGPAKLTKALKINKTFNDLPVYTKKHGLWIENRSKPIDKKQIVRSKRIGVDYAGIYKDKLWRFYVRDNPFVSKK